MRKTILALTLILVISLVGTAFAMEAPKAEEVPRTDDATTTPSETVNVVVNNDVTPPSTEKIQDNTNSGLTHVYEELTTDVVIYMSFFDIEQENVLAYASMCDETLIKYITGTVTTVTSNELQVYVETLDNTFCFQCVDPYAEQLGEEVTIWIALKSDK